MARGWVAEHPQATAGLASFLLLLTQVQTVFAEGSGAVGG